jgi:hypothetical protein
MSAARADPDLLARITEWVGDGALALADLGYEGEPDIFRTPFKKPADTTLTMDQQACNTVHGALRCLGERVQGGVQRGRQPCMETADALDIAPNIKAKPDSG